MVWWAFILFLYLLSIYLPFHLVYIAVFQVAFLYSGSLHLYCEGSLLWVGLDRLLLKVSWLGKFVGVLVGGAAFLLSGVH